MPKNIEPHLPSSFPRPHSSALPSMLLLPCLQDTEAELCFAHAKESLDSLRRYLLIQVHCSKYTQSNVCGQGGNTWSQSLHQQTVSKIKAIAMSYWCDHVAYLSLKGAGDWEFELRELKAEDVRPLTTSHITHEDGSKALGKGNKVISWIWRASLNSSEMNDELHEGNCLHVINIALAKQSSSSLY
jgi:hypothetical protein